MSFEVIVTEPFERKYKQLAKKYPSLPGDLAVLVEELTKYPQTGIPLGKDCYKLRFAISSKGKGKSAGARLITYVLMVRKKVFLLDMYDKSDRINISLKELKLLIGLLQNK
ncbi:MAG: hypothetical protein IPN10_15155 [Saprospiraceae bacterium]|nr:hypothetical protein [Saprospiraceae bacterium]